MIVLRWVLTLIVTASVAACRTPDPQARIVGQWQNGEWQLEFRSDGTLMQTSRVGAVLGRYRFDGPWHVSIRFEEPLARAGEQKFGVRVGARELALCHPTDPHICQELARVANR